MKLFIMSIAVLLAALFSTQKKNDFQSMTVSEFNTAIQEPDVQLIDVRTPAEYADGHLVNAINIDVMNPGFADNADKQLAKEKTVAVYCRSGARSKKAAGILLGKGYKVIELNKGYLSWQEANMPTVK